MGRFAETYTYEQREALATAYVDRGLTAPQVVELAAAGALTYAGERLEPFEARASSVRSYGGALRRRRAGLVKSSLTEQAHRDAIEALRVRLISAADRELAALERQKPGTWDLER